MVGCSVAYHLTRRGVSDVVLLERNQLTSGTTWHGAGLVGQLRASHNMTRLARYTAELLAGLEADTGQSTGFRQCGSVSVASNAERFEELKRQASMARVFGLPVELISPGQVAELIPQAYVGDLMGGLCLRGDGVASSVDTTQALARGARLSGALVRKHVRVDRIVAAGEDHGLKMCGYHAQDSPVDGYRSWGHDISTDDTPLEAGLGFAAAWHEPGGFIGRERCCASATWA